MGASGQSERQNCGRTIIDVGMIYVIIPSPNIDAKHGCFLIPMHIFNNNYSAQLFIIAQSKRNLHYCEGHSCLGERNTSV